MQTAALFKNGGSQAVRLPKAFRFEGNEVFIKQIPEGVLLIPKEKLIAELWAEWDRKLAEFDEPLEIKRGGPPQQREGLDDVFP